MIALKRQSSRVRRGSGGVQKGNSCSQPLKYVILGFYAEFLKVEGCCASSESLFRGRECVQIKIFAYDEPILSFLAWIHPYRDSIYGDCGAIGDNLKWRKFSMNLCGDFSLKVRG